MYIGALNLSLTKVIYLKLLLYTIFTKFYTLTQP